MHRVGDGGEKSNAARHGMILVGFEPGLRQERPHVLHERLEESLELLLVLLDVQVDVVADGRLDAIDGTRLVGVRALRRRERPFSYAR